MTARPEITLCEVGPRDGLQSEKTPIPTAAKIALVNALSDAGFSEIEVSSFVSPKWVPQLGDAAEVFAGIQRRPGVVYSALVPNFKGFEAAMEAGVHKIAVFTAASETFSRRNTNATIEETLERFAPVVAEARAAGVAVRGYISCVVACPYEGPIAPAQVAEVVRRLLDLGIEEIDLGETIGVAAPTEIERLYEGLQGTIEPGETVLHVHDTRGTGLANLLKGVELGVRRFDTSVAGVGGCPFAPGAAGNLATEDAVYCLERMGWRTGIDLAKVVEAGRMLEEALGRPLPGRTYRSMRG